LNQWVCAQYRKYPQCYQLYRQLQHINPGSNNVVYDWHLRIEAIYKFVQNEDSKSLIEADKRIRNIFKDIDSEDRAGGCGSSPQGIERRRDGRDKVISNIRKRNHYRPKQSNSILFKLYIIIKHPNIIKKIISDRIYQSI
jgi:hypothetical protein